MNEEKGSSIEDNFDVWFKYSQSFHSAKLANQLKRVLKSKESQNGFEIRKEYSGTDEVFYLTESYNPTVLALNSKSCDEFYQLICNQFPIDEIEQNPILNFTGKTTINQADNSFKAVDKTNQKDFPLNIFSKISSKNIVIHSVYYSIVTFFVLQICILPGNVSDYKLGSWSYFFFFGVFCLVFYASIWSYSKLFRDIKLYNDIFKFSTIYSCTFYLLVFIEIMIIDSTRPATFSLFFSIVLIFFGQIVGVIFGLFLALVMYFVKGGKMVNMK